MVEDFVDDDPGLAALLSRLFFLGLLVGLLFLSGVLLFRLGVGLFLGLFFGALLRRGAGCIQVTALRTPLSAAFARRKFDAMNCHRKRSQNW